MKHSFFKIGKNDSKTFVDMAIKTSPEETLRSFNKFMEENPNPQGEKLKRWVLDNFHETEEEEDLQDWDPPDYNDHPAFIDELEEKTLRYVAKEVNVLWNVLGRKSSNHLKEHPEQSSLLYLPFGFVIPGGRFREIYYWDTYWIVRGLIHCNMVDTVKGILQNFFHQINLLGFVPNGTRTYYKRRTQPPYLLSMVFRYLNATKDWDFVKENLHLMEKEIEFFENNRQLEYVYDDKPYQVFRYGSDCKGPRPESYLEDYELAQTFETEEEREEFYLHIKAGAESGWDFSSRWFIDEQGTNRGTLLDAKTNYIIPVDLNCLMFRNYNLLGDFCAHFGLGEKETEYRAKANKLLEMVSKLLWDPQEEMWFDYDMLNHKRRTYFYASNLYPLWAECYPTHQKDSVAKASIDYLERTGVLEHEGGLPTSIQITGQQWDWNCWPPCQHMIVSGLNKTGNLDAQRVAFRIAKTYVIATIKSCGQVNCAFFEKYHPETVGMAGGGGEYDVQHGFGWTNGVLIDFIVQYGDKLIQLDEWP